MANENNHSDRFEELCAGYVLNALEPGERKKFEVMLETADEEQLELYHKLRSTANNLAFSANRTEPSEDVKRHLFEVISSDIGDEQTEPSEEADSNKPTNGFDKTKFAIAASFALLLVTLSLLFYAFNLSSQLNDKTKQVTQKENIIQELEQEIERKNEMLAILESRQVDMVLMEGLEVNPQGYGKIIWNAEEQQALLQVSNLPPVPSNKQYQLWIIKNNEPFSAGLFSVNDPKKDSFFKIEQMESADERAANAFAITLEPEGGVPKPTGDMYLLGNIEQ